VKDINNNDLSCTFVIFGGTGDLTHRKLMPALYNLLYEKNLPKDTAIVAIGRRDYDDDKYRQEVYNSIKSNSRFNLDEGVWSKLKERIYYKQFDFLNTNNYCQLNDYLETIEKKHKTKGKRIYYLAVAPEYFESIVDKLNNQCMGEKDKTWPRLVIEKPFGRDLESATYLNNKIVDAFTEDNTYRIDHYLGKEMLQNIMVIRFANSLYEPSWNHNYIKQVQILSSETLGVETRGEYYEKSGAIRDMLQSHLLQLLSLIAMDIPSGLDTKSIRDEKVKVLKSLKIYSKDEINDYVVRGQYGPSKDKAGYQQEPKVNKGSKTETYIALKAIVENERWKDVPFYIRTGKKMPRKTTEIIIQFKKNINLYNKEDIKSNQLVIKIQPEEGF